MLNIISIIIDSYIPHLGYVNTEFSDKYTYGNNVLCFKKDHLWAYNWRRKDTVEYRNIYKTIYTLKVDRMQKTCYILPLRLRIK